MPVPNRQTGTQEDRSGNLIALVPGTAKSINHAHTGSSTKGPLRFIRFARGRDANAMSDTIEEHQLWQSFWDLASPEKAAVTIMEMYGSGAADAAGECVASATADDRNDDARFWTAVQAKVIAARQRRFNNHPMIN